MARSGRAAVATPVQVTVIREGRKGGGLAVLFVIRPAVSRVSSCDNVVGFPWEGSGSR